MQATRPNAGLSLTHERFGMNGRDKCGPHFLGIGGHRSGSTWLFQMLRQHPGVWMPHPKELHYFDRSEAYGSPSYLGISPSVIRRFIKSREYRLRVVLALRSAVRQPSLERIHWDLLYLGGTPGDEWYRSLFEPGRAKLAGEITPAYSMLSEDDVDHVANLLPDAKILFLIRNPVDRAWSAFQYNRKAQGALTSGSSADDLPALADQPRFKQRSDYLRTLRNWARHYSPDRFFVGFFDDIRVNPEALLKRVFDFLGLDAHIDMNQLGMNNHVNASEAEEMPPDIRRALAAKYRPMVAELADQFGGYATKWLEDIDGILA